MVCGSPSSVTMFDVSVLEADQAARSWGSVEVMCGLGELGRLTALQQKQSGVRAGSSWHRLLTATGMRALVGARASRVLT